MKTRAEKIIETMKHLGRDKWHSPTLIANIIGENGLRTRGSAWACPTLKKLVRQNTVSRNIRGHYRLKRDTHNND